MTLQRSTATVAAGPRILNSYNIAMLFAGQIVVAAGPRILNSYNDQTGAVGMADRELRLDREF